MILSDFRYHDPWAKAEEAFTLPNLFHRSQLQQRENQRAEANRKVLDRLLDKLSHQDIVGLDAAREYLRHKYRQNCKANTLKNDFTTITLFLSYLTNCGRRKLNQISKADLESFVEHEQDRGLKIASVRVLGKTRVPQIFTIAAMPRQKIYFQIMLSIPSQVMCSVILRIFLIPDVKLWPSDTSHCLAELEKRSWRSGANCEME